MGHFLYIFIYILYIIHFISHIIPIHLVFHLVLLYVFIYHVILSLSHFSCVQLFATLWMVAHQAPLSIDFLGKNTRVGCHAFLQGIFPTRGSNQHLLCFLHWQAGALSLVPPGKPHMLYYWLIIRDISNIFIA